MGDIPSRKYAPSEIVRATAERVLAARGRTLNDAKALAESVRRLSDFFIANPDDATPWHEPWAVEAYFAYYLPLNEIRNRAAVDQGKRAGFFAGLKHVVDFGAGPGTADFALEDAAAWQTQTLVERSDVPARLLAEKTAWRYRSQMPNRIAEPRETLFVASYSLTEAALPKESLECEALMILEPSTQSDGRRLLDLRARLRDEGYSMWAPCPHQLECPLRKNSPRDWCHDRVHVDRPPWLEAIESHLPFRNLTVTYSYLLARRTPASALPANTARLVGDRLEEKGKDRQMVCRSDEREFLAWMHRHGRVPELPRGILVELPADAPKTSNEIRLQGLPAIP